MAAAGGLWEPERDAAYVVLLPPLRDAYKLPEELRVTADPDVAREDGATLLAAGHPVLAEAAECVLASGDTGHLVLARPASVPPGHDVLLAQARNAFPVDHGRIDLSGEPAFVLHPVILVGALVTYELSAEDRFQEEAQRWVDLPSRRELPADMVARLCRAEVDERARPHSPEGLLPGVAEAHRLMDAGAAARRQALAAEVSDACQAERGRPPLTTRTRSAGSSVGWPPLRPIAGRCWSSGCEAPARSGPGGWSRSRRSTRRAMRSGRTGCTWC